MCMCACVRVRVCVCVCAAACDLQRTLVPALNAFLDGVNGCIVLFGSAASQRVQLFQGDATTPGIIPKVGGRDWFALPAWLPAHEWVGTSDHRLSVCRLAPQGESAGRAGTGDTRLLRVIHFL